MSEAPGVATFHVGAPSSTPSAIAAGRWHDRNGEIDTWSSPGDGAGAAPRPSGEDHRAARGVCETTVSRHLDRAAHDRARLVIPVAVVLLLVAAGLAGRMNRRRHSGRSRAAKRATQDRRGRGSSTVGRRSSSEYAGRAGK